jgi:lipid-A-disaccharide synthase-like uncharacterized protein
MEHYLIYGLGFTAQLLFFARTIAQWFKSEKEGKIISPVLYWQLSLLGSVIMVIYGLLRLDFAIVLGQFMVYFIYIRNLQLKNAWLKIHRIIRGLILVLPLLGLLWLIFGSSHNLRTILGNQEVSLGLMIWGSAGQIIFTFRFIYQWLYSENKKSSVLPLGFWLISTLGSLMIFIYSLFRLDPVLFAAHSLGLFIYLRNILLHYGKKSLLGRLNIPFLKRIFTSISDKIH